MTPAFFNSRSLELADLVDVQGERMQEAQASSQALQRGVERPPILQLRA